MLGVAKILVRNTRVDFFGRDGKFFVFCVLFFIEMMSNCITKQE